MQIISRHLLNVVKIVSALCLLSACAVVNEGTEPVEPEVDTTKPASYAEYKAWRDRYDSDAREYAEFKLWEEQYRRWKWEQQQQTKP